MTNSFITVNYHYVRPIKKSKYPNIKGLSIKDFCEQLNFLQKKYNIISAQDLVTHIINNFKIPKNSCLLTFDDGYKDHYKYVMPELVKRKISACFFPSAENIINNNVTETNKIHFILDKQKNPDNIINDINLFLKKNNFNSPNRIKIYKNFENIFIKRYDSKKIKYIKFLLQSWLPDKLRTECCAFLFKKYLNVDEKEFSKKLYLSLKEIQDILDNGMTVGGHGYRHIRLGDLKNTDQKLEIDKMINFLHKFKIKKNWIMCYPYGSYNNFSKKMLTKKNCLLGFSATPGKSLLNKRNILSMKRYDTNDFPKKLNEN